MSDKFLEQLRSLESPVALDVRKTREKERAEKRLAELQRRRDNFARLEVLKRAKALVWNEQESAIGQIEDVEPVLDAAGVYQLGNASLTVSSRGALCLNSPNMFIADIDGDLDTVALKGKYPWMSPLECIIQSLSVLDELAGSDFKAQSYRIYTTYAGYRVICTSTPIEVNTLSLSLLRFLWSDPRYAVMCEQDHDFRARLTPKAYRVLGTDDDVCAVPALQSVYDVIDDWFVCERVGWFRNGQGWYDAPGAEVVHPELLEQLRVHDDLCLRVDKDAKQA